MALTKYSEFWTFWILEFWPLSGPVWLQEAIPMCIAQWAILECMISVIVASWMNEADRVNDYIFLRLFNQKMFVITLLCTLLIACCNFHVFTDVCDFPLNEIDLSCCRLLDEIAALEATLMDDLNVIYNGYANTSWYPISWQCIMRHLGNKNNDVLMQSVFPII